MKIKQNLKKDIGRLLFWYPLRWIVFVLPYSALYHIASQLGTFEYLFLQRDRSKKVSKAIQAAVSCTQAEANRHVKQNLINHYANTLELIRYPDMDIKSLQRFVSTENIEYLDSAMQEGNGVILMTAHFGAKQLLQVFLGRKGYPVNQINHHVDGDALSFVQKHVSQRLRKRIESKLPITFIASNSFQRKTLECLKKNQVLIVAGDGSGIKDLMDSSYRPYNFLGKSMLFPSGPETLAKKTGALIIPVFVIRENSGHRIVFEKPISHHFNPNSDSIKCYSHELERKIISFPYLWDFWEEFEEGIVLESETTNSTVNFCIK